LYDIAGLEFDVMRKPQSFLMDCFIRINPNYNDRKDNNEEMTVAQM